MGTITRSFANNITTSGVLLPASLNNNSIANVTSYNPAILTGNMVLLSSQTASNSASVSFTTGIDSTYKEYQFWFVDIRANGTDIGIFSCNFSTDGGSNYNVTKTTTNFGAYHTQSDTVTDFQYNGAQDLSQSSSDVNLMSWQYTGRASADAQVGFMSLFNPASTTYVKHFIATVQHNQASISDNAFIAGYANTTSAINAVRFVCQNGNLDGTILMYGIN